MHGIHKTKAFANTAFFKNGINLRRDINKLTLALRFKPNLLPTGFHFAFNSTVVDDFIEVNKVPLYHQGGEIKKWLKKKNIR